jgi:uncharacterized membrane protein
MGLASCGNERGVHLPPRHRLFRFIVIGHALALFAWSACRHANYGSHAFDLGCYHQTLYNLAAHGSLWSPIEQFHSWSSHLEVGLLPIALLYAVAPTPLWLFAIQAAGCAACALPVELLARRLSGDAGLALVCGTATLLTPQLLFASIADFHSVTLCALPMALLVVGIELDALALIVAGALLALSLREQMGLAVVGAAAAWVVRHGAARARVAMLLGAVGLAVFFAEVLWLIPSFAADRTFRHLAANYRLGSSPRAALDFALARPLEFAMLPFEGRRRLVYPIALGSGAVLPILAALPFAARRVGGPLLVAGPLLLVQLYSARVIVFSVESQYGAPLVPLVAAAAVLGIVALAPRWRRPVAVAWLVVTALHALASVGPLARRVGGPLDPSFAGSARAVGLARAVETIPRDAVVSAQDTITPHLEGDVHLWPQAERFARFVVLDANAGAGEDPPGEIRDAQARLRADDRFQVRVDEGGVLLVERRGLGP